MPEGVACYLALPEPWRHRLRTSGGCVDTSITSENWSYAYITDDDGSELAALFDTDDGTHVRFADVPAVARRTVSIRTMLDIQTMIAVQLACAAAARNSSDRLLSTLCAHTMATWDMLPVFGTHDLPNDCDRRARILERSAPVVNETSARDVTSFKEWTRLLQSIGLSPCYAFAAVRTDELPKVIGETHCLRLLTKQNVFYVVRMLRNAAMLRTSALRLDGPLEHSSDHIVMPLPTHRGIEHVVVVNLQDDMCVTKFRASCSVVGFSLARGLCSTSVAERKGLLALRRKRRLMRAWRDVTFGHRDAHRYEPQHAAPLPLRKSKNGCPASVAVISRFASKANASCSQGLPKRRLWEQVCDALPATELSKVARYVEDEANASRAAYDLLHCILHDIDVWSRTSPTLRPPSGNGVLCRLRHALVEEHESLTTKIAAIRRLCIG